MLTPDNNDKSSSVKPRLMRTSRTNIFTGNPLTLDFLIEKALSCQDYITKFLTFGLNWGSFGRTIYNLEEKEKERYLLPLLVFIRRISLRLRQIHAPVPIG